MALTEDQPDVQTAALAAAHTAAGRWITTRFPDMPEYVGRYLAAEITKIVFPFVKIAAHADLADALWAQGIGDVAAVVEANGRQYLDELTRQDKETRDGVAAHRAAADPGADGPAQGAGAPD